MEDCEPGLGDGAGWSGEHSKSPGRPGKPGSSGDVDKAFPISDLDLESIANS